MLLHRHLRIAVAVLVLVLVVACGGQPTTSAPSASGSATPVPVQKAIIGWSSADAIYAPLWYGADKGILKKHGIEPELIFLETGSKSAQGLIAGQVDIALSDGVSVVNADIAGAQIKIVGMVIGVMSGNVYVGKDIQNNDQLKGKRWGISTFGSESHLASQLVLASFNIDPKDVTIVQIGSQGSRFAALQSGQIQVTSLLPPVANQAEAAGFRKVAELPKIASDYLSGPIAVTAATLQQRPALVKQFLKAYAESTAAYKKDRAGGIQIVKKYLNIDDANVKNAEAAYDYYSPIISSTLRPTDKSIQFHLDKIGETDPRAKTFKVTDMTDLRLLTEIENEGFFKTLP